MATNTKLRPILVVGAAGSGKSEFIQEAMRSEGILLDHELSRTSLLGLKDIVVEALSASSVIVQRRSGGASRKTATSSLLWAPYHFLRLYSSRDHS